MPGTPTPSKKHSGMQLQLSCWRNVFVVPLLDSCCPGCTLVPEHFTCVHGASAATTEVNTPLRGNTQHLLNKPVDASTLFVFSLSCTLPGQTVPVLQESEGLCWPGGLCCVRRGLQSNPGEGGGAKHRSSTPGSWAPTAPRAKLAGFSGGLGLEGARERGRGRAG